MAANFITAATYQVIWPDVGATTYTINSANNAAHLSLDGTGIPPMLRNYVPFAQSDGGIDQGFRLDVRRMVWKLFLEAETEQALDTKRDALWNIFRPLDDPLKLKVTKANGAVRQIDVYVDGPIEVVPGPGYKANVTIPLVAPDPLWYDPVQQIRTFPLPDTSLDLTYAGSWQEWPIVKIYGSAQNLVLENVLSMLVGLSSGRIDFNGHTIPAAAIYTVDLRPGVKTVVDGGGVSKLANMGVFTFFPYFCLYPEPLESGGNNNIVASYGTLDATAAVVFEFYNRYIAL